MADDPTYPGTYVNEAAAISHDVEPVTTNLTALVGVFPKGSTDRAVLVTSWPMFTEEFGDLDGLSTLAAYAVSQFFANGGAGAWIVRLDDSETSGRASVRIAPDQARDSVLEITAASPGTWSQGCEVSFTPSTSPLLKSTHSDFTVQAPLPASAPLANAPPGGIPPATKLQTLETIPNLAVLEPDGKMAVKPVQLAAQINAVSKIVTASVPKAQATPAPPGPAGPQAASTPVADASPSSAKFSNGRDATWSEQNYVRALKAELTTGSARLDEIAPALFNLMCLPDVVWLSAGDQQTLYQAAHDFCRERGAFLIMDPPPPSKGPGIGALSTLNGGTSAGSVPDVSTALGPMLTADNVAAAAYYPWVSIMDPVTDQAVLVPPSGLVAGVYARTDRTRGVWKAPAGIETALGGVVALADPDLDDAGSARLNVVGINCLRTFPLYGTVVWGGRTLAGSDIASSPFKYVPVRRLADYIEQSLRQSLRWAVFEPNGAPLWSSISLEVQQFLASLYAQGAFEGATAEQAYTVICDATTTSPSDIQNGIVNVFVGFAAVDPAESVILNVQISAAVPAS